MSKIQNANIKNVKVNSLVVFAFLGLIPFAFKTLFNEITHSFKEKAEANKVKNNYSNILGSYKKALDNKIGLIIYESEVYSEDFMKVELYSGEDIKALTAWEFNNSETKIDGLGVKAKLFSSVFFVPQELSNTLSASDINKINVNLSAYDFVVKSKNFKLFSSMDDVVSFLKSLEGSEIFKKYNLTSEDFVKVLNEVK